MQAGRSVISPALIRWLETAEHDERRTVTVQLRFSTDPAMATAVLTRLGAEFAPPAQGAVICTVTPPVLQRMAELTWVQAIGEPRRLFPRG